jgi:flavin-dependent dehydrogenase
VSLAGEPVEVLVVGGGPAGAAVARRLAGAGRDVLLVERRPVWRWHACGVFSSPVTVRELRALGIGDVDLSTVARPIPRLWVESPGGSRLALSYGHLLPGDPTAIGFDRSRLDPLLLDHAAAAGARVLRGAAFQGLSRTDAGWAVTIRTGAAVRTIATRVVVGADGVGSRVARSLGVARPAILPRVGLTFHVPGDPGIADGRMAVLRGAYCGLAPVPGGRVNVGIVLAAASWRDLLARDGARAATDAVLRQAWHEGPREPLDHIAGIAPIGQRVARRAGPGWLLVGDAAGFLDPFTGEGLHRALVSARLGADAVGAFLRGRHEALPAYDAAMTRRFRAKDLVSWVVQGFVAQPRVFEYATARLVRRATLGDRFGRIMGDLAPAADAFDPRFLAALLAP